MFERLSAEEILQHWNRAKAARYNWDNHWRQVAELVWPEADDFYREHQEGERRNFDIYDETAQLALEKFAATHESLATPRDKKWHSLRSANEEVNRIQAVREWLEFMTRELFKVRADPRGAYYSNLHVGYKSLGAFGNQCLFTDWENGTIVYRNRSLAHTWVQVNWKNEVDTVFHLREMTARAIEQQFQSRTPEMVRNELEKNPWKEFRVLHVVDPLDEPDAVGHAWSSTYICVEAESICERGNYYEMPYHFSRYTLNPDEIYGRGPAMQVLPAIKMTNRMMRSFVRSAELQAEPPILLPDDSVLGSGSRKVRLRPAGLNYGGVDAQGRPLMHPFNTGANLAISEELLRQTREVIQDAFLVRMHRILVEGEGSPITATEAVIRNNEKGILLAPAIGRQQSELLGPQITREINLLIRSHPRFAPPPEFLESGAQFEVVYESPASRFQRHEELEGIVRTLELALPLAEAFPDVTDMMRIDETLRLVAEIQGMPAYLIRDSEQVEQLRQAREREQAAVQALAMAEQGANIGEKVASAQAKSPDGLPLIQ